MNGYSSQDCMRFWQLFRIAFPDMQNLRPNCTDELKRHLLTECQKINPNGSFGSISQREVYLKSDNIISLYKEVFAS